jgi:hypothetical protein
MINYKPLSNFSMLALGIGMVCSILLIVMPNVPKGFAVFGVCSFFVGLALFAAHVALRDYLDHKHNGEQK